jgi:hypothetical protein
MSELDDELGGEVGGAIAGLAAFGLLRRAVEGIGRWAAADQVQMGLYILQDVHRAELRREGAAFTAREERRKLRHDLLAELGAQEVFPVGAALLSGADGRPDHRPAVAAVSPEELVLLDADVVEGPEVELGRIPRGAIAGVRLRDEHGEPVDVAELDERADLKADRFVVWVDRADPASPTGSGAHGFVFFSGSVAAEAARDFERARLA